MTKLGACLAELCSRRILLLLLLLLLLTGWSNAAQTDRQIDWAGGFFMGLCGKARVRGSTGNYPCFYD